MLSEISQSEKDKHPMISSSVEFKKQMSKGKKKTEGANQETDS